MLFKFFIGRDSKNDYGLDSDFSEVLGFELINCNDLMVKDLIEIDNESHFITKQLKGLEAWGLTFEASVSWWLKTYLINYIKHLYGSDIEFHYGIFKNGNCKYILAYYRKHLRDIKGMVEFDDALDFLEKMREMKIKEPKPFFNYLWQ
ncbi:hypothetical protein COL401_14690 [Helicobacter pylori]